MLGLLEKKGYIVEANDAIPHARAAFWDMLDLDPRLAESRLKQATVSVVQIGAVPVQPFASVLATLNIQVGEDGDFAVVLTDDYLQGDLAEFNAAALTSGRPWLLVKPLGAVLWIGPVFQPGKTACWECLAQRVGTNRQVESYLYNKKEAATPFPISRATLPVIVQAALHLAATETAKAIVRGEQQESESELITLDMLRLETQKHTLLRHPQCPQCGYLAYRSDRDPVPVMLRSQKKQFTEEGGHRVISPEQTLKKYEHHVSSITGAVTGLGRTSADEDHYMHVYVAGHNLAGKSDSLYFLRRGLRANSGGKGMTDVQAKASALCEALERYSGNFRGDEIRKRASYRQLGTSAIHPNTCMLFSEKQYQRSKEWNTGNSFYLRIPDPLDEAAEIEWTPVWSLSEQEFKYLPTDYCYYGYPVQPGAFYCLADSNGNAAGNTLEEAILQGFFELVERDSVCLWWYNRVQRPAVDLDSFDEPYIQKLRKHYVDLKRDLWVLDLTSDLQIPVFAALSRREDKAQEEIMFGFGAHFDPRIGVLRALTELNQFLVATTFSPYDSSEYDPYESGEDVDPVLQHWSKTATLANQPYLVPDNTTPLLGRSNYDLRWSMDVREDVLRCQEIVEQQGMEVLVLDQTRPDIGLPVAKVFVPGLRHFWERLAPGRLYDVPVKLGWLKEPLAEDELNPIPMFL
jgi:ribosomal protein S12 methylthiotransferase accessory factor